MQINVTLESPQSDVESGPIVVGWLYADPKSSILYDPPSRVRSVEVNRTHAKSASRCPAVINLESRYFEIKCPFDLNIAFVRDDNGRPGVKNLAGEASGLRTNKLRELLHIVSETEWRYKDRPTIQLTLPFVLVSDEPVYLQQIAPYMHYAATPWPGTIFGGRFPINVWPRQLMWAFEWCDVSKPLVLKRGDPLCYLAFDTYAPDRPIQMVEVERTPELDEFMQAITGAVNYVNQTFSLFKTAQERRPAKLVQPKKR